MSIRGVLKGIVRRFGVYDHPNGWTAALAALPSSWRRPGAVRRYAKDVRRYMAARAATSQEIVHLAPFLEDASSTTPVGLTYFYQDTWAAKQVFRFKPQQVVDIGSTALLVGVLSQFCRVISVDIRPLPVTLPGLECRKGTVTELPFADASVEFVTSLCVLEHIGLGRYGDPIDPLGTERAVREIQRVLAPGGVLAASIVAGPPCTMFNAHRIIPRPDFLALFPGYGIEDEVFISDAILAECPESRLTTGSGQHYVYGVCLRKPGAG